MFSLTFSFPVISFIRLTLEKDLEMRPLTLRALRRRALFKVQVKNR